METNVTNGINILRAIELSNKIRSAGNHNPIKDLIPGIKKNSQSCVLANSFNCGCKVKGFSNSIQKIKIYQDKNLKKFFKSNFHFRSTESRFLDSHSKDLSERENKFFLNKLIWFAYFEEEKYAQVLADELGTKVIEVDAEYIFTYSVMLPKDVGAIAKAFDEGKLDRRYERQSF